MIHSVEAGTESDAFIDEVITRGLSLSSPASPYEQLVLAVEALSLTKSYEGIRRVVSQLARVITGADGATYVIREDGFCSYVDEDAIAPLWKGCRFPIDACVSGWSITHGRPAIVPDIYADARIPQDAYRPTFVKSLLVVPVRSSDPIGAIGTYWARHHDPTEDEVRLLQSLADATSVAVQNVSLFTDLKESVAALEKRNHEMERLVQMISHDLKTPLINIGNHAGLLHARMLAGNREGAQQNLDIIEGTIRQLRALLRDLSVVLEASRGDCPTHVFSVAEVVEEAMETLSEGLERGTVRLAMDPGLPLLTGDRVRMRELFEHLIDNTIRYRSPERGLQIEIGASIQSSEVHCWVRDNGIGIDPAHLQWVFGTFHKLSHSGSSTGIGLTVARRIVTAHGGRIWAESRGLGHGTVLHFVLPRFCMNTGGG